MIRLHAFNSEWWGSPSGIVSDPAFFDLPQREREEALSGYAWVEFRCPASEAPDPRKILSAGFFHSDSQCHYRLALNRVSLSPSTAQLTARFADEQPFGIDAHQMQDFRYERFTALPGITPERLAGRYAMWANRLIAEHPAHCIQVLYGTAVQGWMLGQKDEHGFDMTLGMRHRDASISGLLLYQKAAAAYAQRGERLAVSSFSPKNISSHNVHAQLGARFTWLESFWLWVGDAG